MASQTMPAASTSSFVTDVLATTGRLEKEDLNAKLGKLSKRTEELKVEVQEMLQKKYGDFYPNLNTALDLNQRVQLMTEDMDTVANTIENELKSQLNTSTAEFQDLFAQLSEAKIILTILDKFVKIHDNMQAISAHRKEKNFVQAARCLKNISNLLEGEEEKEIKIIKVLKNANLEQHDKLHSDIIEVWNSHVKWNLSKDELSISKTEEAQAVLANTVQAMHDIGQLTGKLQQFGSNLLQHMIQPLFTSNTHRLETDDSGKFAVISINRRKKKSGSDKSLSSSLICLMGFLNEHLLGITLSVSVTTETGTELKEVTLMEKLGEIISQDLLDFLIKEYLAKTIPTSHKELEAYDTIICSTTTLQDNLAELKIIPKNNTILTDYVNNINVLFANKKCQEILEKARLLMTADLHNMIRITKEHPFGEVPSLGGEEVIKKKKVPTATLR